MFILSELFNSLALLVEMICNVLYFLLVIRIIVSWFQVNPDSEITRILYKITEPILAPFRRLPLQMGAIDFSPIVAFIALFFLKSFIVGILTQLAYRLS